MLLYENIGSWRELPKKKMPLSKFLIQNDRDAFEELVMKSTIPSLLSYLAKHFRAEFRARHTYAV